jgi:predicted nucleic acid-binding protein
MANKVTGKPIVAVLDACVLYSAATRDVLLWLAAHEIYEPRWIERIQNEWSGNLLSNRTDLEKAKIERTRQKMKDRFTRAFVVGWEKFENSVSLPDKNDCHVVAAAIVAKANYIINYNIKHFLASELALYKIQAKRPDDFLGILFEQNQEKVIAAVREQRSQLRKPPKTAEEYLGSLHKDHMKKFTALLRPHINNF